jgi:hypothetical protein
MWSYLERQNRGLFTMNWAGVIDFYYQDIPVEAGLVEKPNPNWCYRCFYCHAIINIGGNVSCPDKEACETLSLLAEDKKKIGRRT